MRIKLREKIASVPIFGLSSFLVLLAFVVVQTAFSQLVTGGGYWGVKLSDLDGDRAKVLKLSEPAGAEVLGVLETGAAEKAGIRTGDVILQYNGETVLGAHQLGRLVAETPEGRKVMVRVWRDGRAKDLQVVTGGRSAEVYGTPVDVSSSGFVSDVPAPLMVWRNMILGFDYEPLNSQLAQFFGVKQGSLIRSVEPGSLAERSGIRAGDILTGVGGHALSTARDLGPAMRGMKAIPMDLCRDRKAMTVFVNLNVP